MIVDAHVHVFRPASVLPRAVDALVPPERDAPVGELLATMEGAGVDRAVLVPLGPEDAAVAAALAAHPGRFAAVAVADAAVQGRTPADPLAALERRRAELAFRALRTGWLGEPDRPLAESPMLPVLRRLADRGLLLWAYLAPDQRGLLEELPRAVPGLRVVLNHLGVFPHDMRVDAHGRPAFDDVLREEEVASVLRLARHPEVHVMVSGQYALSREPHPHRDLDELVRRLADAYGADRLLAATDWPWIAEVPGYAATLALAAGPLAGASPAELAAVRGDTARRLLFPDDQEA